MSQPTLPPTPTSSDPTPADLETGATPAALPAPPTRDAVAAAIARTDGHLPPELTYAAVRVMVAAALSDGHLVSEERDTVERHLDEAELTPDQQAQVRRDLVLPATVEELADLAPKAANRELLYQLAAVVLQADGEVGEPEKTWLERLGTAFALAPERRRALEAEVRTTLEE